jgi:hypothetical protein
LVGYVKQAVQAGRLQAARKLRCREGNMTNPSPMRASASERKAAAEILRRAYTAGRLNGAELEDRTGRAYAARTWGELDDLIGDLPALPEPAMEPWRLVVPRPAPGPLGWACLAVSAVAGASAIIAVTRNGVSVLFIVLWLAALHRFGMPLANAGRLRYRSWRRLGG